MTNFFNTDQPLKSSVEINQNNKSSLDMKIGVLGGGQLGKMILTAAAPLSLNISIMENASVSPASPYVKKYVKGDLLNYEDVIAFGSDKDVLTIEIENVNVDALKALEERGVQVHPFPKSLEIIQDKGLQKQFYDDNGFKTAKFECLTKERLVNKIDSEEIKFPFVLKTRRAGYDGNGVAVIRTLNDLDDYPEASYLIEEKVDLKVELSVIAARNKKGEIKVYDVVEVGTVQGSFLMDHLSAPANIDNKLKIEIQETAKKLIDAFQIQGLLAVEFFLDNVGNLYINEVSPRPHNTGHHTIESDVISQYEQHLRGILNLPLGSSSSSKFASTVNVLGPNDKCGKPIYDGLEEVLSLPGVYVHLYGKLTSKPMRKLGHITIIAEDKEALVSKREYVNKNFKVKV